MGNTPRIYRIGGREIVDITPDEVVRKLLAVGLVAKTGFTDIFVVRGGTELKNLGGIGLFIDPFNIEVYDEDGYDGFAVTTYGQISYPTITESLTQCVDIILQAYGKI